MMKFLRSQSQTVLVVVLGVIAIGFLFYGNAGNLITQGSGRASNDYGRIDGQDLTVSDLYDAVRSARNAVILAGQESVLRQPGGSAALAERAWQDLLLQREADKLHVYVTDQQVADWIRKQPLFQKDGAFDLNTYNTQIKALQTILHISTDGAVDPAANTQAVFESFVRNNLRMDAVKGALLDTVRSPAGDIEVQYQKIAGPATISYVVIDPKDYETRVQVTPGDIEAEYKDHPENPDYRTKERRKVDYVLFLLTPEQAKLPDDQKRAAKDALGQKALDFALAFQPNPSAGDGAAPAPAPPDFNAEAEKRGLTPGTTDFFTDDSPPAGVPPSPAFNRAAFSLTKDNTVSRVVELDNGVAVLHLGEIQASALRPLAEVKAGIQKHLLQTHAAQAAQVAAGIDAKVLQATVSGGADFKTAATGMKLRVVGVPAFVPSKLGESDPKLATLAYASLGLKPNQVSEPVPLPGDASAIIHLESRGPADPAGLEQFEAQVRERQDGRLRAYVLQDWANWKSKQPGTRKPADLDAYGSID